MEENGLAKLNDRSFLDEPIFQPTATIEIPSWQRTVTVRGLTGDEVGQVAERAESKNGRLRDLPAWYAVRCIIDENGKRVFADSDEKKLNNLPGSGAALQLIVAKIQHLTGIAPEQQKKLLEGN